MSCFCKNSVGNRPPALCHLIAVAEVIDIVDIDEETTNDNNCNEGHVSNIDKIDDRACETTNSTLFTQKTRLLIQACGIKVFFIG